MLGLVVSFLEKKTRNDFRVIIEEDTFELITTIVELFWKIMRSEAVDEELTKVKKEDNVNICSILVWLLKT